MQFRAGILYVVLFVVVAAGAYGVIATAEAPEVTVDEADADYVLSEGDEFEVDGQTWNVTELTDDSGTIRHVETGVTFDTQWEGASAADGDDWDAGDTVQLVEGEEYHVYIHAPPVDDDDEELDPEEFSLIGEIDEDEYEVLARDDGVYVIIDDEAENVNEVDDIESQTFEVGDEIEFYEEETQEAQVEGEIDDLTTDTVFVQYLGDEVTEHSLEHEGVVLLDGQEYVVYFPGDGQVYLTGDTEHVEAQQDELEEFNDRITGLWWVVGLAGLTAITVAGLAYMPVRG